MPNNILSQMDMALRGFEGAVLGVRRGREALDYLLGVPPTRKAKSRPIKPVVATRKSLGWAKFRVGEKASY